MASTKEIRVSPRVEEILIGAAVGAGVGLALAAPFVTGLPGYLPHDVTGLAESIRAGLAWIAPAVGAVAGACYFALQPMDTHLSGMLYIPRYREARRRLQALERPLFTPRGAITQAKRGLTIGGVELSHKRERTHFEAIGQTGQGKTTLYNAIVDQAIARGDRVILFDVKGDIAKRYFDGGKTCVLMGPWVSEAVLWDAPKDFDDPAAVTAFAQAIMEVEAARQGGKDPHWVQGGAAVLSGIMRSYMRGKSEWTWAGLHEDLQAGSLAMVQKAGRGDNEVRLRFPHAFLPQTDAKHGPFLDKEESSMARSVADGISGWMEEMSIIDAQDAHRERFSFSRWLTGQAHKDVQIVIFNFSDKYAPQARRLFGSMMGVVGEVLSGPRMPAVDPDGPGVWCIFDEVVQMGRGAMEPIRKLMELGRDKGARVLIAFQSVSQLKRELGKDGAEALLDQAVTPIYMHPAQRAAKETCDVIGTRQIARIETNASNGAIQGKVKKIVEEPVLRPSDLESLGETPDGIELILQIKDVLGRLLQPFMPRRVGGAALTESETWKWGALRALEEADKRRAAQAEADAKPSITIHLPAAAVPPPPAFDDDELDDLTLDDPNDDAEV